MVHGHVVVEADVDRAGTRVVVPPRHHRTAEKRARDRKDDRREQRYGERGVATRAGVVGRLGFGLDVRLRHGVRLRPDYPIVCLLRVAVDEAGRRDRRELAVAPQFLDRRHGVLVAEQPGVVERKLGVAGRVDEPARRFERDAVRVVEVDRVDEPVVDDVGYFAVGAP